MIERGLGISFLPLNALGREIALGTLARVALEGDYTITLPTGVMVRKASSYGAIVTAFLELLRELYPSAEAQPAQSA
jgi:DNA-binding transcriptional LysR family regulator